MVGGPGAAGGPDQIAQGILALGQQLEKTLINFAQAMPEGAQFFQQANELVKQGIAASMAGASGGAGAGGGQPPAASPTSVGPQFPGGGIGSGARP